jgi:hypothetical protein
MRDFIEIFTDGFWGIVMGLFLLICSLALIITIFCAFDCGFGKDVEFTGTIINKEYHSGYYQTYYINNQMHMNYIPEEWKFTVKCKDGIHYSSVDNYTWHTIPTGYAFTFKASRGFFTNFDYSSINL